LKARIVLQPKNQITTANDDHSNSNKNSNFTLWSQAPANGGGWIRGAVASTFFGLGRNEGKAASWTRPMQVMKIRPRLGG
jgi:hypothetical protein